MKKQILSLILSLALTFNMAGITAFAQGESVPQATGETICTCTPTIGVSDVGHTNGCPCYPKSATMARTANNYGSYTITSTLVFSRGTTTTDCTAPSGMNHYHDSNHNTCWGWNLKDQELGLSNIDIDITGNDNGIYLGCDGTIQLIGSTVNAVTVSGVTGQVKNGSAIYADNNLTIYGGGTLNARLTGDNADSPCIFAGNQILIQNGNVTAVGTGHYEAAIECGTDGDIVISGGTVTATSSGSAAAITCGNGNSAITLNGGRVTATAAAGAMPFSEEPITGGKMKLKAGSAPWNNLTGEPCTYEEVELSRIEVTTPPTKTTYKTGESFDKTGMVVTAVYSDGSKAVVPSYVFYPSGALAASNSKVTVSYTENRVNKTADVAITVSEEVVLSSIEVTTPPTKTTYKIGEPFDKTGMVVTAVYSDGSKAVVPNYTVSPAGALAANDSKVTVSYIEGGVTKTADVAITVSEEVVLSSIEVTTPPTKTTYKIGEPFDKTGMVVTAVYSDGSKAVVTNYAVSPAGALAADNSKVTVSYAEGGVTKTADVAITVSGLANTKTVISANKTSIIYGESVTLTATVTKTPADGKNAPAGKVQFKVDGKDIGTAAAIDQNGKATITVDKATLQAAKGGKTYSFAAMFTSTDNAYTGSADTVTVTVAQRPLTIAPKTYEVYQYRDLPDLTGGLVYTGFVAGEGNDGINDTLKATYLANCTGVTTDTLGDKVIKVTSEGIETNTNYAITLNDGILKIFPAKNTPNIVSTEPTGAILYPAILAGAISSGMQLRSVIAEGMIESDLAQVKAWMKSHGVASRAEMYFYDMALQKSIDNGKTWVAAKVSEDVKGGVAHVGIPIGDLSTADSDVSLYHFEGGADGVGKKIPFSINKNMVAFYADVKSLSPFVLVVTPKNAGGTGGDSSDNDEYAFWMSVKGKIEAAKKGDVIKADAKFFDKMPESVMEALGKKSNVTLVINWNGGKTITIPADKVQKPETGRISYPLSMLAERYKDIKPTEAPASSGNINPETGGPGYLSYGDGIAVEAPVTQQMSPMGKNSITATDKGIEADAFAEAINAEQPAKDSTPWFVVIGAMLAAVAGSGVWFHKKKHSEEKE